MMNTAATSTPYANYTVPTYIGWGTANGFNATSVLLPATAPSNTIGTGQWSDIAPFSEASETRTSGTVSVTGNAIAANTVTSQVVGTLTSGFSQSIGESFLVFTATKPYESTLNGNLAVGATSLTVTSNWPAVSVPFYLQLDNEVVTVSATSSTVIASTIVRGVNGSVAATHNTSCGVSQGNIPGAGTGNPHNADMFAHAGFVALALNNGDSIQFTWQVGVTS